MNVSRIAVRYINAIDIPLPMRDFGDYLSCPPDVPESLPQAIAGFLQRVIIPDPDTVSTTIVTQALENPGGVPMPRPHVTVLLDIDVFRTNPGTTWTEHDVWDGLEVLRNQKNRVFFAYLTETAMEMFL